MPQRIFRKFSSRRKRRKYDEDASSSSGKTRAQKTLSNTSGSKIDIIEEEQLNPKTGNKKEETAMQMQVLDTADDQETVNNEFVNEGYQRTGSATSEEQDASPKASDKNTLELDTISETPLDRQNGEKQDSKHDNVNTPTEGSLLDRGKVPQTSLQDFKNEHRGKTRPTTKGRPLLNRAKVLTPSLQEELKNDNKEQLPSSTDDAKPSTPSLQEGSEGNIDENRENPQTSTDKMSIQSTVVPTRSLQPDSENDINISTMEENSNDLPSFQLDSDEERRVELSSNSTGRTLADSAGMYKLSVDTGLESELGGASGEDSSSTLDNEWPDPTAGVRVSSTDC